MSKLKACADDKFRNKVDQITKFVLDWVENIMGKGEKRWLSAFSPFHIIFSKAFSFDVVKSRDCVVKS